MIDTPASIPKGQRSDFGWKAIMRFVWVFRIIRANSGFVSNQNAVIYFRNLLNTFSLFILKFNRIVSDALRTL
jgi:hypothetical protein